MWSPVSCCCCLCLLAGPAHVHVVCACAPIAAALPTLTRVTSPTATTLPPVLLVWAEEGSSTPPMDLGASLSTFTNTRSPTGFTAENCRPIQGHRESLSQA